MLIFLRLPRSMMLDIKSLRVAMREKKNITSLLRDSLGVKTNSNEIIEIAYDLQAGSYAEFAIANQRILEDIAQKMGAIASDYISAGDTLLDCGAGELTTLSFLVNELADLSQIYAFDISHSRIRTGVTFAESYMHRDRLDSLEVFIAEMGNIPMRDKSIDIVMCNHAVEPNHGREQELIAELARVARRYVIMFEPSYEKNSEQGKRRMEELGYVRGIPNVIRDLGLDLVREELLKSPLNALNPTCCYVIKVGNDVSCEPSCGYEDLQYICPRSGEVLEKRVDHMWSYEGGYAYPIVDGIPILRKSHSILKTKGL